MQQQPKLSIDLEVQNLADLKKVGLYNYAADPSIKIPSLAFIFEGQEFLMPRFGGEEQLSGNYTVLKELPYDVINYIKLGGLVSAWNVEFEYVVWNAVHHLYGWPRLHHTQCYCTMALAASRSHPQSLERCGEFMGLEIVKSDSDPMMRVCVKHKDGVFDYTQQDLVDMYEYNIQDVRSELAIAEELGVL